jgi:hypothetical protein
MSVDGPTGDAASRWWAVTLIRGCSALGDVMNHFARLRHAFTYVRPFGLSDAESLMNTSPLGTLRCHCEPTDAAQSRNDRRKSCRRCGNAILEVEPTRLYEQFSRREIRGMVGRLRRAGIDAGTVGLGNRLTSFNDRNGVEALADMEVH